MESKWGGNKIDGAGIKIRNLIEVFIKQSKKSMWMKIVDFELITNYKEWKWMIYYNYF